MPPILGTNDGVWEISGKRGRQIGLKGRRISHAAVRVPWLIACVPHDGLYARNGSDFARIWEGDARACAVSPDGTLYVGSEPAMVHWSAGGGKTWRKAEAVDRLPTRKDWDFPPPPHLPHVRSIDFLPGDPKTVLVGIEVGGFIVSRDGGNSWEEMNSGLNVDVHTARPDPSNPAHFYAVTGGGFHASMDAGRTWERRMEGVDRWYTAGLHVNPEREGELLIAAGDRPPGRHGRLYHSDDGGGEWHQLEAGGIPADFDSVPVPLFADGAIWIGSPVGDVFRADDLNNPFERVATLPVSINALAAEGVISSVDSGH